MSGLNEIGAGAARDCVRAACSGSSTAGAGTGHASGTFLAQSSVIAPTSVASSAKVAERCVSLSPEMGSLQILVCVKSTDVEGQSCYNMLYNSIHSGMHNDSCSNGDYDA